AAGQQITVSPEQPAAQIIDLFEALKQSLRDQNVPVPAAAKLDNAQPQAATAKAKAEASEQQPAPSLKGGPTKASETRGKRAAKKQTG
ncbi:MAG: hypothetical protein RL701_1038, partial [Pseudomonadota bacterium]